VQDAPTAVELRCASCGSSFQIDEVVERVRCPFCNHQQDVARDLIDRLEAFRGRLDAHAEVIAEERRQTARFDAWYGRMRKGSPAVVLLFTAAFMLGPMLIGFVLWGLVALIGQEATDRLVPFVPIPLMLLVFASLAGWIGWMYSGQRRKRSVAALEAEALACPGCGAVSRVEPGATVTACSFCGASLVPSEPVMGRALAAAQRAKLAARIERYRAEREGIAKALSYGMPLAMHWFVLGPFTLMACGGAFAFSFEMLAGREPFHPGIFLLWAMGGGCVAAGVGISGYQRVTRQRWRAALAAVARGSGGEVVSGLDGLVGWLDRHWAGPYDLRFVHAGKYAHGATLYVEGFAGLLWVDPTASSEHHPARTHLFLAAWIPGVADDEDSSPSPEATDLLENLRREHDVQLQQGGLFLPLDDADVTPLRRDPTGVTQLATVFVQLAALARALGASPVHAT